jgi:hypothetical protein
MSFSGRQQQQHNHQLLQYFCSKCGILLKETEEEEQSIIDNQKIVLMPATATTEQCLKCGSLLSSKNLIRKLKLKEHNSIEAAAASIIIFTIIKENIRRDIISKIPNSLL